MSSTEQHATATGAEQGHEDKGKGKAVEATTQPTAQTTEDDDSSSDEDMDPDVIPADEVVDDDFAEIDTSNIIIGSRTRGKQIDFSNEADAMDDEEDDDEDFQAQGADEDDEMDMGK